MFNTKKLQVNMDIRTSVNYTEVQILKRSGAFFVDTDFGRICIEPNAFDDVNPARPVTVLPWAEAPDTRFAKSRCRESADYWASIDIYGSTVSDHLSIIEVFIRSMFMSLGLENVDETLIDAAVYLFVAAYDPYSINVNMIEREFVKNHLNPLHLGKKRNKAVQSIVREMFLRKISSATSVYHQSEKLLSKYLANSTADVNFYDEFCKELFGLILYANADKKDDVRHSHKLLINYNDSASVNKSVMRFKDLADTVVDDDIDKEG